MILILALGTGSAVAQVNGEGQAPYLGWSSWSQEVIYGEGWATEAEIEAQSDALKSSGLQAHGYVYISIDSGWQGAFDANGRPIADVTKFPDGMAATIQHIHNNGQKAGIYWIPGVQQPVYDSNPPILGTPYFIDSVVLPNIPGNAFSYGQGIPWHMKIDFTQPGAQAYVNSVVDLFASWGVDLIKLDGVTPGSDHNNLAIDNRPDVAAWSQAIAQSGRPIWLTISWALDHDYLSTWQSYANARRIEDDVDCYCSTLTTWASVSKRFNDLVAWQSNAGPTQGWNDLDSLEVGNGSQDGLTTDERQSVMTLWAIANAPLFAGDDLTQLDSFGIHLLTDDAVIAVDQSAIPGIQIQSGTMPIWASNLGSGVYYVALFNLDAGSSTTAVNWSSLGFSGNADVRDLWANADLGLFNGTYSAVLNSHASQLLKVTVSSGGSIIPAIALTASPNSSFAGSSVTLTAAVQSPSGIPDGTVDFNLGSSLLGSGTLNAGVASLATTALPSGTDAITAVYQGDLSFSPVTSNQVMVSINPAFGITAAPTALTLSMASKQASSVLTIDPGGNSNTLSFACANLPASITCSFSPPTLALAGVSTSQTVSMTLSDSGLSAAISREPNPTGTNTALCGLWIALPISLLSLAPIVRRNLCARLFALAVLGFLMVGLSGCASSSNSGSPSSGSATTYNFAVNVSAGATVVQTLQYSVAVQ